MLAAPDPYKQYTTAVQKILAASSGMLYKSPELVVANHKCHKLVKVQESDFAGSPGTNATPTFHSRRKMAERTDPGCSQKND